MAAEQHQPEQPSPVIVGIETTKWLGGNLLRGARQGARLGWWAGQSILERTLGEPDVDELAATTHERDLRQVENELARRNRHINQRGDYGLADMLALQYVKAAMRTEQGRQTPVETHIEETADLLRDNGIAPQTVEVARERLYDWAQAYRPPDEPF